MSNHLTLWIPGLRPGKQFASELGRFPGKDLPDLSSLNRILSRAERIATSDIINHDFILHQLDLLNNDHCQWPLAQWRLAHEKVAFDTNETRWLCADPVYIHPDRSEALLYAHDELDIAPGEAQQLATLINQHFHDDPWELHVASTHRWYIKLKQPYDITTHALHHVKGKNIFDFLPSGKDARYWQQCMNELQMLLHGSEINQRREEKNQLPVNSLWLWGYAESSDYTPLHWRQIYSDDMVLNGLGVLSGTKVDSLPDELDDIQNLEGDILVVVDQLQADLHQLDIFTWLDDLQYLEHYWFAPLLVKLRQSPDLQVTLLVSKDEAYQFTDKQLKRWWRFNNKNKLF